MKKKKTEEDDTKFQEELCVGSVLWNENNKRVRAVKTSGVPGLNQILVEVEDTGEELSISKRAARLLSKEELNRDPFRSVKKEAVIVKEEDATSVRTESKKRKRPRDELKKQRDSEVRQVWAQPDIRVRIISSKHYPMHYKRKGVVIDITTHRKCHIRMDNGELLENVSLKHMETALPKIDGVVMILRGKYRSDKGRLLEKQKRGKVIVQIFHSGEGGAVERLELDDVAEFCGPGLDEWQ